MWYKWHSSLWDNHLSTATDNQGPLLLHGAMRSRLAVKLVQGPASPIKQHQAKALQLQLLIRHLTRSGCLTPTTCSPLFAALLLIAGPLKLAVCCTLFAALSLLLASEYCTLHVMQTHSSFDSMKSCSTTLPGFAICAIAFGKLVPSPFATSYLHLLMSLPTQHVSRGLLCYSSQPS